MQLLAQELERVSRELEENKMMQRKAMKERDTLLYKVVELETILVIEQRQQESKMKSMGILENHITELQATVKHCNDTLLQNITEFQARFKRCEEREMAAQLERESLRRDREQLEKRVAQLEATLASEQKHHEQEEKSDQAAK